VSAGACGRERREEKMGKEGLRCEGRLADHEYLPEDFTYTSTFTFT
jgi:hypothetical protein